MQIKANRNFRVPLGLMMEYPEFGANPFGDRLCQVFSSTGDGSLDFEDFINCISTFQSTTPMETKIEYLFQMYGKLRYVLSSHVTISILSSTVT